MKKFHSGLRVLVALFLLPMPAHAALEKASFANGKVVDALPRQVLVRYKPGLEFRSVSAVRSLRATSRKLNRLNTELVHLPEGLSVEEALQKFRKDPNVLWAEPNMVVHAVDSPNDPEFVDDNQYALSPSQLDAENAWDISTGSPTVIVAVIDTGVTLTHQDLCITPSGSDCADGNLWVNPAPSGDSGLNGKRFLLDWNGDNDCNGVSSIGDGPDMCAGPDPTDDNDEDNVYHGTHVAGIIAALTNNNLNMAGLARNCKIMALKVLNRQGSGDFAGIIEAIDYARVNGASIINLSLGVDPAFEDDEPLEAQAVRDAVQDALDAGIVVIAASGNKQVGDTRPTCPVTFPASITSVIAVGATNSNHSIASFSCRGTGMDLVAPGVGILSLTANPPNSTSAFNGTSFAAPMASAVAALIRSLRPDMSVSEVTSYLLFTATDLGSTGYDTTYGYGLLNAYRVLRSVQAGTIFVSSPSSPGKTFSYPNPFRPAVDGVASIVIPASLGSDGLEITILTLAGEKVRTLTGTNQWDGRNESGSWVASGMYFFFAKTSQGDVKGHLTLVR